MPLLLGTAPNQVPTNGDLGTMAFQDAASVQVGNLSASGNISTGADANIYGVTVGRGAGNLNTNTAVGASALVANIDGIGNTAIGAETLRVNTTGYHNAALGQAALYSNTTGIENTALGQIALYSNISGVGNTAAGNSALFNATGTSNTAVGNSAGYYISTGAKNTILGRYDGNQGGLDIRTSSNNIVISDGDGNPRIQVTPAGNTLTTGTFTPQQATTAAAPAYVKGAMYFDTTLNKLRIGGATAWETVTSV